MITKLTVDWIYRNLLTPLIRQKNGFYNIMSFRQVLTPLEK